MGEQAARAGEVVEQLARLDDLLVRQEPPVRIVERRAAQQRQAGVTVVIDLLDVVLELVLGERWRRLLQLGIPVLAGERGQPQDPGVVEVIAYEMGLHIEDELTGEALRACLHQLGLVRLGGRDLEHARPVDLVHRQERRGHAAARLQELPPAQAESLAVLVRQLEDAPLDVLLRLALGWREILAVRHDLGRYRGCGRSSFGTDDQTLLSLAEPSTHRPLPRDGGQPLVPVGPRPVAGCRSLDPTMVLHNVQSVSCASNRAVCSNLNSCRSRSMMT